MKGFAVCVVLMSALAVTDARFRRCGGSGVVDLDKVEVTGCASAKSRFCVFKRGQNATMSIPFTPSVTLSSLKATVHGVIAGIPMPFPLDHPEACNRSIVCPAPAGTTVPYKETMLVKTSYPALSLTIKWELKDQFGKDQVCLNIPVKLQ